MGRVPLVGGGCLALGMVLACFDTGDLGGSTAATDAGTEANPPPGDGGPGATNEAGDAGSPFCASLSPKPTFCSDFDSNPVRPYGWDAVNEQLGSAVLDGQRATSAPNALLLSLNAGTTGSGTVSLSKTLTTAFTTIRFAASVWHDPSPPYTEIMGLYFSNAPNTHVALIDANGQVIVHEQLPNGTEDYSKIIPVGIPTGKWTRIELFVDKTADKITVSFDGTPLHDFPIGFVPDLLGDALLSVNANLGPAWSIRFDDVVVDVK